LTRSPHLPVVSSLLLAGALVLSVPAALEAQYGSQGFGKNKIQYRDFNWKIYRSPHFNVHYYDAEEPQLQKLVSMAESAYDQLSRGFNFQIKDPVPLIYYATHSAFEQNNIILNFIPEGVGAFASPARFRMVLPIDLPDPELYELILHELTHIFQYHMLFQGSLAKAVATTPPTWFMEGMASYMAKDESARDRMFLRDAVVNDNIPSVTQSNFGGFFAYRFGHAVFDFIEERWGREGFLDFLYETRNTIGSRVDRAVERTFKLEPEEFDLEFRRWLRKKYLPELIETGEPGDFGRVFRIEGVPGSQVISPSASPSGDLVAALAIYRGDVDVVLFDTEKRRLLRNLTRGFSNEYQYLVAQEFTLGRKMGRDLDFSPDGNTIAVFAKREKGRSLVLLNVLQGGLREIIDIEGIEQQHSPAWSPDGRKMAFSGWKGGQFDIFVLDLESREIVNVTNDTVFDGAPTYSPDGRSIVYASVVGEGFAKLFRTNLDQPGQRFQLTTGESSENDPVFAPDGQRIYYTSDRAGRENIYSLDLTSGTVRQYTDVVTGAFMPTLLREREGRERLVYTGFWKSSFELYSRAVDQPVREPETVQFPAEPALADSLPAYEPDIQVSIDEANKERYAGFKFFLEDAQSFVGVDDDQTFIGAILLTFSDNLGDRRILANISSIDSFSNFDILYADLSRRWQWQVRLFDDRDFYLTPDFVRGTERRDQLAFQQTGAIASVVYPFTFYQRAEVGLGYVYQKANYPIDVPVAPGVVQREFLEFQDDFPLVQAALVGDSTVFANYGAISGRRWRLGAWYAPDLQESGALAQSVELDFRQYFSVTQRSNLAFRAFAGWSDGNRPNIYYIGGLDTLRGTRFRELAGYQAFFANIEYRFPLIDVLATPVIAFQGVRGILFFDIGGAWFDTFQDLEFYSEGDPLDTTGTVSYGRMAYGAGVTVGFVGFSLNWDFAEEIDPLPGREEGFRTSFWIGTRF
jgi:Tol biopolymer transport system component